MRGPSKEAGVWPFEPAKVSVMKHNKAIVTTLVLTSLGVVSEFCVAQHPASDKSTPVPHAQAYEVQIPVTVRDKHGNLVTNLQKGDLTLTEDGRNQVIQSLSIQSPLPYQVGLLVQTSRGMMGAMEEERKATDKFVDTMLPSSPGGNASAASESALGVAAPNNNEAFLIHFDREVELLQDFTEARDKLHKEIDEMGPTPRSGDDEKGPETMGDDREHTQNSRATAQLFDAIYLAADELMKPKSGRKSLIILSDGIDRGSKETLSEALDAADHANLTIYAIYLKGDQQRSEMSFPGSGRHGGMGGGFPGGGGGYPSGRPEGGKSETGIDGKKIMAQIASRTGGRYFDTRKKEDLTEIYGLIADELKGQYLLTYTPDMIDKDGGYHKVAVKANSGDLTVVTREGYYAPEAK